MLRGFPGIKIPGCGAITLRFSVAMPRRLYDTLQGVNSFLEIPLSLSFAEFAYVRIDLSTTVCKDHKAGFNYGVFIFVGSSLLHHRLSCGVS